MRRTLLAQAALVLCACDPKPDPMDASTASTTDETSAGSPDTGDGDDDASASGNEPGTGDGDGGGDTDAGSGEDGSTTGGGGDAVCIAFDGPYPPDDYCGPPLEIPHVFEASGVPDVGVEGGGSASGVFACTVLGVAPPPPDVENTQLTLDCDGETYALGLYLTEPVRAQLPVGQALSLTVATGSDSSELSGMRIDIDGRPLLIEVNGDAAEPIEGFIAPFVPDLREDACLPSCALVPGSACHGWARSLIDFSVDGSLVASVWSQGVETAQIDGRTYQFDVVAGTEANINPAIEGCPAPRASYMYRIMDVTP